jgi:hypothetical protein
MKSRSQMSEEHGAYSENTSTSATEDVLWAVLTEFQRLVAVHCRAAFFSIQAVFESPEQPKNCPSIHNGDNRKEERDAAAAAQEEQEEQKMFSRRTRRTRRTKRWTRIRRRRRRRI